MFAKTGSTRTASLAALIGEPGMGKSRLLGELISRAKAEAPGLLVIGGAADEVATPYGPMARALSARFGFVAGEPEAESRDRIQAAVAEVLPATRVPEVAHLLAYMLRVPFEQSPVVGPLVESPQRLESRTFMAVRRYLARPGRAQAACSSSSRTSRRVARRPSTWCSTWWPAWPACR
jgi:hypothetical protein